MRSSNLSYGLISCARSLDGCKDSILKVRGWSTQLNSSLKDMNHNNVADLLNPLKNLIKKYNTVVSRLDVIIIVCNLTLLLTTLYCWLKLRISSMLVGVWLM